MNRAANPDRRALRLKRRYAAEARFKAAAITAVALASAALATLLITVGARGVAALTTHWIALPVTIERSVVDPSGAGDPDSLSRANYVGLLQTAMRRQFPSVTERGELRELFRLYSRLNAARLAEKVAADPRLVGRTMTFQMPLDDAVDLMLTEGQAPVTLMRGAGGLSLRQNGDAFDLTTADPRFAALRADRARAELAVADSLASEARQLAEEEGARREARAEALLEQVAQLRADASDPSVPLDLGPTAPSVLVTMGDAVYKLTKVSQDGGRARLLLSGVHPSLAEPSAQAWRIAVLEAPEANRKVSDAQLMYALELQARGLIERRFARFLFTRADSSEPELAGVLGAFVGSILTMLVTMVLAAPVGVGAAIYLEEFAPKNRLTSFVEVNINNLAAVPSIVFGLLGVAVLLNFFGVRLGMSEYFGRGFALVGGIVLALRTLPTIIITTRAALKSVPPSIRAGALALGASPVQAVFHHVVPLAAPGILTGTILGLAQALGETAPLLLIGMVAFVADVPASITEPATVLPVQVFIWADSAERAFAYRTGAAIGVLLTVMISLNLAAVVLRRRFERRW